MNKWDNCTICGEYLSQSIYTICKLPGRNPENHRLPEGAPPFIWLKAHPRVTVMSETSWYRNRSEYHVWRGNQVLAQVLTLSCLPWYMYHIHTGVSPKLAQGTSRVKPAPKVNKSKVTPIPPQYWGWNTQSLEPDISEILLRGNPRVPPYELV